MTRCWTALGVCCLMAVGVPAGAGPPYLTDDPEPVALHHWEVYTFYTCDRARSTNTVSGPSLEVNNGVAPNVQLHLIVPEAYFSSGGTSARGLGDIEAGVKYRFVSQTKSRPEIGTFPQLELPTGSQSKGLGNGRLWVKVPLWLQKDFGPWTTYGGGGYACNPAPGQRNYGYGGLLVQRTLSPRLTLGGEVFFQGAQVVSPPSETAAGPGSASSGTASSSGISVAGARESALWNFGGSYNFTPDFSLLFTAGHSFQGDGNAVAYLGLYRTWGPGAP